MNKIIPTKSYLPAIFTLGNVTCGFLAILVASQSKDYKLAAMLIIIAGVLDFLDGIVARVTNSSSKFGVELDSLADVVSFGAAPAYLLCCVASQQHPSDDFSGALRLYFPILFLLSGTIRLARFNAELTGFSKSFFYGLPIPAAAYAVSFFVLSYNQFGLLEIPFPYADALLTLFLSYMMVSRVRFSTIPKPSIKNLKDQPFFFGYGVSILILGLFFGIKIMLFMFLLYIVIGILQHIYKKTFRASN